MNAIKRFCINFLPREHYTKNMTALQLEQECQYFTLTSIYRTGCFLTGHKKFVKAHFDPASLHLIQYINNTMTTLQIIIVVSYPLHEEPNRIFQSTIS